MMLKYEDYIASCWLLGNSVASQDFIRSVFAYGTRQRRALRGYPQAKFGIYVDYDQMVGFKTLWLKLNHGTDKFITDMPIFGDKSLGKTVRFVNAYSITDIDNIHWKIEGTVEIIYSSMNSHLATGCPLTPSLDLVVGQPLVPCGTHI